MNLEVSVDDLLRVVGQYAVRCALLEESLNRSSGEAGSLRDALDEKEELLGRLEARLEAVEEKRAELDACIARLQGAG